jgi:hypothetical protein
MVLVNTMIKDFGDLEYVFRKVPLLPLRTMTSAVSAIATDIMRELYSE